MSERRAPGPSVFADPAAFRAAVRRGAFRGTTAGLLPGFIQANLVVLPAGWAEEFIEFCIRNPRPCPLLDVTAAGSPDPRRLAPGADLRTDLPGYRVFAQGAFRETTDLQEAWDEDSVGFLLGCSFTFERALQAADIPLRHVEQGTTVPMYRSSLGCIPTARLAGPMVVSMRPIPRALVERAGEISARYPGSHGAPVHAGDPSAIGIADLAHPDFGDPVDIGATEVPVFWACGVTPQVILEESGAVGFAAHAPGRMFVGDAAETIDVLSARSALAHLGGATTRT
ncbi:MAG TPA: putative hydro-lyase [Candidatus Limnocylindria bacterium]|nr:putative hydro-lyase [Candidatus Limnocylindria bacterium]